MTRPEADIDLMVITDRAKTRGRALAEVVGLACDGGARWFQLREKNVAVRELLALAEELKEVTAARGARLIINDRADVALAVGADGLHLPASGLPPEVARRVVGEDRLNVCPDPAREQQSISKRNARGPAVRAETRRHRRPAGSTSAQR